MNAPIQLTFDFNMAHDPCYYCGSDEARETVPVLGHGICDSCKVPEDNGLQDPCAWCKKREAEQTITRMRTGQEFGICNSCAEEDYYDWHEQMND